MDYLTRQFVLVTARLRTKSREFSRTMMRLHDDLEQLQNAIKAATDAFRAKTAEEPTQAVVKAELLIPEAIEDKRDRSESQKARRDKIRLGIEAVALIAAVFVGLIGWRAANAAKDAADAAYKQAGIAQQSLQATIDNFHLDQRAWLGPKGMSLRKMQAPNPIQAIVVIMNSGKTPALHVQVRPILHPSDGPLNVKEYSSHPVEPTPERPAIFTVVPNATMELAPQTGMTDARGIQSVMTGRKLLYLLVWITYDDVFGKPHRTQFCSLYEYKSKPFETCYGGFDYAD